MRVLVCGDRNWKDKNTIELSLYELWCEAEERGEEFVVMHGAAKGADTIAGDIIKTVESAEELPFSAEWKKYGKAAGPIRNQLMLDEGKPDIVVAFHDDIEHSKGTKDMVNRAKKAGIEALVYSHAIVCKVYPARSHNEREEEKKAST